MAQFVCDFPYHKNQLPSIHNMFTKLQQYAEACRKQSPQKVLGERLALIQRSYPEDFNSTDSISDHFTEPARMLAVQGRKKSPMETWLSWSASFKKSKTPEQLRDELYFKSGMVNGFNPCIAIYAFLTLSKGEELRVLDPCMGWGDRLIASCAVNAKEYVGFDTNPDLIEPHEKIIDMLATKMITDTIYKPFELTPSEWYESGGRYCEHFDFVLTSPPFWTVEIYNGTETSTTLYKTEKEWYNKFYAVFLDKCSKAIKKGGHLCLYISPQMESFTKKHFSGSVGSVGSVVSDAKEGLEYIGTIGFYQTTGTKFVDERKVRNLYVWRRKY